DTVRPPPRRRAYVEDAPDEEDSGLTAEQSRVVDMARQRMSAAERERVDTRYVNTSSMPNVHQATSEETEQHAGPSRDKGKGPDPRNWGAAELSGDEYDPEVQRQILEAANALKEQRDAANKLPEPQSDKSSSDLEESESEEPEPRPTRADLKERLHLKKKLQAELRKLKKEISKSKSKKSRAKRAGSEPASHEFADLIGKITSLNKKVKDTDRKTKSSKKELKPINQLAKNSSLGQAFEQVRGSDSEDTGSDSSSSDSSSSSESDSGDDSSQSSSSSDDESSSSSSSSSEESSGERKKRHRKSRAKKRSSKKSSRKHSEIYL
ncbi:hypothetical protein DXG01_014408, partial [Tephrocybe rancida]